jgi:hypothetical protein
MFYFIACVVDNGDWPRKNWKLPPWYSQGLEINWFMKKNLQSKISCQIPFWRIFDGPTSRIEASLIKLSDWSMILMYIYFCPDRDSNVRRFFGSFGPY